MALPAASVRSPAKPRMRDLCQCGIGAPNKNILQMSEGRHREPAEAYSGLEQRCLLNTNYMCVNVFVCMFMMKKIYPKNERRRKGTVKRSSRDRKWACGRRWEAIRV